MWPPLDEPAMAQIPGYMSTPTNLGESFLADNTQLGFQSPETRSSSPSTVPLTPSLTTSYLQSPPMPLGSAPAPSSSSSRPEPTKGYTCAICRPSRSYATVQYLN